MGHLIGLLIPGALAVIMFGMGLTLTAADFTRLVRYPRAVSLGLLGQVVLLPLVALALCLALRLPPPHAVGLMLIALAPGGAVSNLFSQVARGDVALSVTLTSVSSVLAVVTLPVALDLTLRLFTGSGQVVHLPLGPTMLHIALITVLPVTLGMLVRSRVPALARRMDIPMRRISLGFLIVAVGLILLRERTQLPGYLLRVGPATVALPVLAIAVGDLLGRLGRLPTAQVRTLGIEVGIQNAILATAVAVSPRMLGSTEIAMVPTTYGLTMVLITFAYVWLYARRPAAASV